MDYGLFLSVLTGLTSAAKNVKDLLPERKATPEIIAAIAEMQGTTIEAYRYAMELVDENRRLHEELEHLRRIIDITKKLTFKSGVWWRDSDEDDDRGPFCPVCWDRDKILVHIHPGIGERRAPIWQCNSCNKQFPRKPNSQS